MWRYDPAVVRRVERADGGALDELPTRGGTELVVVGERFGSVESPRPIAIAARYREEGVGHADAYRAACRVSVEFSEARCTTAAGLGVGLRWTLRVEGETVDVVGVVTSFAPPTVRRVEVIGVYKPYARPEGDDELRILGDNFGPRGVAQPRVRYGRGETPSAAWLTASSCAVRDHASAASKTCAAKRRVASIGRPPRPSRTRAPSSTASRAPTRTTPPPPAATS